MSWFNPFEGKTNGGGGGGSGTTDYGALQNKPQINGIMLNGNLSTSDLHIDIPTTAADVGAMPNTTKYAASIDLSINNLTYVMTAQLKDQDGNNIGSSDSIDLPLETMVINGQYDDKARKIVLTLKSGDTIEFSIADLISGLQAEITSKNKLSADLIQDGNTNKTVTLSEKNTWNSKQNAITAQEKLSADLIQDGNINKTVTASEKTDWGNKQSAITSKSKLSSDLVDDTNNTHLFVSSSEKSTWTGKQNAITSQNKLNADFVDDTNSTNKFVSSNDISNWNGKLSSIPIASNDTLGGVKIGSGIHLEEDGTISVTGGGGGGTSDYSELSNKPQINSTTLAGNKSSSDLGLQPAITSSAKLSADVVDDTDTTHKFVTASDKTTWSGKQDAIADLTTIRNGASAGATSVQTIQIDGTVQTKTSGVVNLPAYPTTLPASDTVSTYNPTGTAPVNGKAVKAALETKVDKVTGKGLSTNDYTNAEKQKLAGLENYDDTVITSRVSTLESSQTQQDTAISAAQAAADAVANAGAKNYVKYNMTVPSELSAVVNSDRSITVTASTTAIRRLTIATDLTKLISGDKYILSGCTGGNSSTTYHLGITKSNYAGVVYQTNAEVQFTKTDEMALLVLTVQSGQNWTKTFYPMIRRAEIADNTFQPYAPTNRELYEMILTLQAQ